jgi:DNA-binding beta-propeller fold protein YncE
MAMKSVARFLPKSAFVVAMAYLGATPAAGQFGPFAYIGSSENLGGGQFARRVVVLDTTTHKIVATIPVSSSPTYLAVAPSGALVLGTAFGSGADGRFHDIHVIDAQSQTLVTTTDEVSNPAGVAFAPDGQSAYVVSSDPESPAVVVVDPASGTVLDEIALGSIGLTASAIAITPDGSTAYVTPFAPRGSEDRFSLSVIDLATQTVTATIPLPCPNYCLVQDVAITPDATRVYVPISSGSSGAGAAEPDLCVGDCNGDVRVTLDELVTAVNIGLGSSPLGRCSRLDVDQDERVAIDELLEAVRASLESCSLPLPTGDFTAVIDTTSNQLLTVIDFGPLAASTTGAAGLGAGTVATQGIGIEITPDGGRAYVTGCGDDICVIDIASNSVSETFSIGGLAYQLAITPDGSRAYVTRLGDLPVVAIDLATNTIDASIGIGFPKGIAIGAETFSPAVIDVGEAIGDPGTEVVVPVSLRNGDFTVTTTQNDVIYLPDFVRLDAAIDCDIAPSISADAPGCPDAGPCKILRVFPFTCPAPNCPPDGQRRQGFTAHVFNDGNPAEFSPIPDGPLYSCRFAIQSLVPPGTTVDLVNAGAEALDRTQGPVPTRGEDGEILVRGPIRLDVGSAIASPGESVAIPLTMQSSLFDAATASIAVAFDPMLLSIEPDTDCVLNPLIADTAPTCPFRGACKTLDIEETVCGNLRFCPEGLEENTVLLVTVGGNTRRIPSGTLLDCSFTVARQVPFGTVVRLSNLAAAATDARGTTLPTSGQGGFIRVLP